MTIKTPASLAIGLSKARKKGKKVPPKKGGRPKKRGGRHKKRRSHR